MNTDYGGGVEGMRKGICSVCDDALICCLHAKQDVPVFYCEEYRCESSRPRGEIPREFQIPDPHDSRTSAAWSKKAGEAYIGLCRTCAHLPACVLLKPGGGTWQCDLYSEGEVDRPH